MCGRSQFGKAKFYWQKEALSSFDDRLAHSPGERIPAVIKGNKLILLNWGVPKWDGGFIYNARGETLLQKWAGLEHVVLPLRQFREGGVWWHHSYPETDLAAAGLRKGDDVVMVTCAAQPPILDYHPRMPLILESKAQYNTWLTRDLSQAQIMDLCLENHVSHIVKSGF